MMLGASVASGPSMEVQVLSNAQNISKSLGMFYFHSSQWIVCRSISFTCL
jgi:hypothetical protein